jgi:hypothetical protein
MERRRLGETRNRSLWRRNELYRGGIYDQQDATNSQYLFLEMLYMFRAIIAHHQELGTMCSGTVYKCEVLSSVGNIPGMVLRWW